MCHAVNGIEHVDPKCLAPHVVKLVLQKHVAIIKQTQGESTTVCERAILFLLFGVPFVFV